MDTDEIERLARAAGFIFRGAVHAHWTGEAPPIPAEAGEAVATRVAHVLRGTQVSRGFAGQDALVVSRHAGALRQSRHPIVFAEIVAMGRHLVLRDLGHLEATEDATRAVVAAINAEDERPFRERVTGAELIVTGEVVDSRPTEDARRPKGEHDPVWWLARVAVRAAYKGRKPRGEVEVLFPASTDRDWFHAPKLYVGTAGILLLRPARSGEARAGEAPDEMPRDAPRTAYVADDPMDLLPIARLAEVERVLGDGKGGR